MKLSVIVPVYNLSAYVEECLISVLEQQTDFEFEVVVIDDGSSDDSWDIMQQLATQWPQLRALQNPQNIGVCLTIRALLEQARGDYLVYIDGDDVALPGKLQALADHLDTNPECNFVYHEAEVFDSESNLTTSLFSRDYYNSKYIPTRANSEHLVLYGLFFNTSSCAFRRHSRMLDAVNLKCKVVNDYSWHVLNTMYLGGSIDFVSGVYGRYRIHKNSICATIRSSEDRRIQALDDMLNACELSKGLNMPSDIINKGKAHLLFSVALYFLRKKNYILFEKYIVESSAFNWFFDERHEFAYLNRIDWLRVNYFIFNEME